MLVKFNYKWLCIVLKHSTHVRQKLNLITTISPALYLTVLDIILEAFVISAEPS